MDIYGRRNADNPSPCYGCTERHVGCGCGCEPYLAWKEALQMQKRSRPRMQCSSRYHGKPLANGNFQRTARQSGSLG